MKFFFSSIEKYKNHSQLAHHNLWTLALSLKRNQINQINMAILQAKLKKQNDASQEYKCYKEKGGNGRRGLLTSLGLEEPNTPQPTSIWATDSIHGALSHCGQSIDPWGLCREQQQRVALWAGREKEPECEAWLHSLSLWDSIPFPAEPQLFHLYNWMVFPTFGVIFQHPRGTFHVLAVSSLLS